MIKNQTGSFELGDHTTADKIKTAEPYLANERLAEAVKLATKLGRPLLIEGEPGCGKTRLAYHIASELELPIFPCYLRSDVKLKDTLYRFDALKRLYDIQEVQAYAAANTTVMAKPLEKEGYVELGAIGKAIKSASEDQQCVMLIDEIDKANPSFPNDLLQLLEEFRFNIDEVEGLAYDGLKGSSKKQRTSVLPIVIITSNQDRMLPHAFLRRCIYYYIDFPDQIELVKILKLHGTTLSDELVTTAISRFREVREYGDLRKKPSTSEFIDWTKSLEGMQEAEIKEKLAKAPLKDLPFLGVLLKSKDDFLKLWH